MASEFDPLAPGRGCVIGIVLSVFGWIALAYVVAERFMGK